MSRARSPHSFLTALSPIDWRPEDPEGRLVALRRVLAAHEQLESPFRQCPMAHMVRVQVIDTARPAMGDVAAAPLKSSWLLFVAELDGSVDDFLDALYRVGAPFVHSVWGCCVGYPPYEGAVFFRRYIARCRVTGELPYAAFPFSVPQTLRLLARKEALADFAGDAQGLDAAALQAAWRARREAIERPDVPRPGTL